MKKLLIILFFTGVTFWSFAQISLQKAEDGIFITDDGEKVLFYQTEPKSKDGTYTRSNYIHPLWGPNGAVLTEDFPADHLHHRGIFWAWHQVWIDGKRIGDPWETKDFEQDVVEVEFLRKRNGSGVLKSEVQWKSEQWKKQGEKVPYLKENTVITIHPETRNYRKIDFEIRLLALEENLKLGGSDNEKGYGGFSVRMKLPDDVQFSGPQGEITPQVTAVKSPGYVNISGSVGKNGKKGGIVIVDHPGNPNYPQPWILRAKNSMQNPVWPGREPAAVSTEEPVLLRYSVIVYSGKMSDRRISRIIH